MHPLCDALDDALHWTIATGAAPPTFACAAPRPPLCPAVPPPPLNPTYPPCRPVAAPRPARAAAQRALRVPPQQLLRLGHHRLGV